MPHPRQHIPDLARILKIRKVEKIVISPGSRSAPLIRAFVEAFGNDCISIVDERSAAYFALGVAVYTGKPVAMVCTSGTAVLNYGPAMAEAFYQHVPLLAITADRPHEWIDQYDNQTLRQHGIFNNYIKRSFELPQLITTDEDLWFAHRMVNDAVNICTTHHSPVHINVPLTEPLYDELPPPSEKVRIIPHVIPELILRLPDDLLNTWISARSIMIVHGQDDPRNDMLTVLRPLLKDPRVVIVAENISNIRDDEIISDSNLVLSLSRRKSPEQPDLLIHSGGQVVSKSLTGYLRRGLNTQCWRVGTDEIIIDTFKLADNIVPYPARVFYSALGANLSHNKNKYRLNWLNMASSARDRAAEKLAGLPFSDVHVFGQVMKSLPEGSLAMLGNSSVIRYSQLFRCQADIRYYSNRGVSGIDGALSTAAGIAAASNNLTIAILGDLGFLYDSNAMWNRELSSNLRILVVNNQGGGIFHILKGPSEQPGFDKFIEANHPVNIAKLAEAYGLKYLFAGDDASLAGQWPDFINPHEQQPVILEVKTNAAVSAATFRSLMASQ